MEPLMTRRERKLMRRLAKSDPYLEPLFEKMEKAAAAAESFVESAQLQIDAAERRERDTAREMDRLRRRIAELESRP